MFNKIMAKNISERWFTQPSGSCPQYAGTVQYMQTNKCGADHQQIEKQKSHDFPNRCKESILWNMILSW